MKRIRVLALAAAAVCLPTLVAGESALASHGSARKLEAWVESADVFASPSDSGWQCNMSFATGVIERGKHGVQRFKVRFRIYAGDTGYSPEWLNSWTESIYFDGAWSYGRYFPNDISSYQTSPFRRNWVFPMRFKDYTLWARSVGIRPSWWQPDLKHDMKIGLCSMRDVSMGS